MVDGKNIHFSGHALFEMTRRNISQELIYHIVKQPDRILQIREGRVVLHKTLVAPDQSKALLYRVFVDIDRLPNVIVTVYATSKIAKYEAFQ